MAFTLEHPYLRDGFTWLRGNLHTHTTRSDGDLTPEEVLAAYEDAGYDFLALSDHDLLVPPLEFQMMTRLTLLPADEVTARGPHILAVGIQEVVPPVVDRQRVINATNAQGGFTILNHPNWQKHFNHCSQENMEAWQDYVGIEIYNGVVERCEGSALATDRWDRLLATGRRVWGFANDDFHSRRELARGWSVVQATERTPEAILESLRKGRFYASTGVEITRIEERGGTVSITAPNAQRIRFLGGWGAELLSADAHEAEYTVDGFEQGYLRVECYGMGGRMAWTQPFFL